MELTAEFNTNRGRKIGEVVKVNSKTILVRVEVPKKEEVKDLIIPKYTIIKRHKVKHNVEMRS